MITKTLNDLALTNKEHFRALLSDSVSYMLKAGRNLKELYPKMVHITCLVHALHNVCEYARELNKKLHEFIISVKKEVTFLDQSADLIRLMFDTGAAHHVCPTWFGAGLVPGFQPYDEGQRIVGP